MSMLNKARFRVSASRNPRARTTSRSRWLVLILLFALAGAARADGGDADTASFDQVDSAISGGSSGSDDSDSPTDDAVSEPDEAEPERLSITESTDLLFDGEGDFGSDADQAAPLEEPVDFPTPDERNALGAALFVGLQIIFTGEVVLESPDVKATTDTVIDAVFANGGAIWGQDSQGGSNPRTVLTVRVPPADFPNVMASLTGLDGVNGVGVIAESVTTDDVTEVVVDLDARIIAAEGAVQRVQDRLDEARDLNLILQLEEEVAVRQADLERLRGQRKTIGDRIALSSITVTIVESDPDRLGSDMEVVAWLGENMEDACPGVSDLSIEADGSAVLCVQISNTGEDVLTDIDVTAPAFRLRRDDFTVDAGNATLDRMAPDDDLLVYAVLDADDGFIHRVDASGGLRITIDVTATPETTENAELERGDSVFISADRDDPLPGFSDSFSGGWSAMIFVLSLLMLVLGAVLPFIPIIILVVWLGRKGIAAGQRRAAERKAFVDAYNASQK